MILCVVRTGSDAVRGGAERPEPAARFRAGGSGVDAGAQSDHQGSHGPVITSVGAVGKAEQAGFLQGVRILRVEMDIFLPRSLRRNNVCVGEEWLPTLLWYPAFSTHLS